MYAETIAILSVQVRKKTTHYEAEGIVFSQGTFGEH